MLLARVDRRDSDGGDSDDVPPPLPTTSPPKLSPDSTLTWDHKERMQLKLGNFEKPIRNIGLILYMKYPIARVHLYKM